MATILFRGETHLPDCTKPNCDFRLGDPVRPKPVRQRLRHLAVRRGVHAIAALLMLAFVAGRAQFAAAVEPAVADRQQRAYQEINRELRNLIRAEARAVSDQQRADTIFAMTRLYEEIRRDPRLAGSPTLRQYRAKLWSKLTRLQRELEREFGMPHQSPVAQNNSRHSTVEQEQMEELADWSRSLSSSVTWQMDLGSYSLGGPARVFGAAGGSRAWGAAGGAARPDYGPALVELIQRTIAPNFWDVNGGPGTIVYFAPLHALVVRATAEIHGQLGGVVGGLRAAGN